MSRYNLCKELRCLPKIGGLDDQDWLDVHFFQVIVDEVNDYMASERKKSK